MKEGESYVFRVRAQNYAGVGQVSAVTEPVVALTKPGGGGEEMFCLGPSGGEELVAIKYIVSWFPGTKEIVVDVDDNGVVSLNFECGDMTADSKFVWSKNYEEITDPSRLTLETKGNKWEDFFFLGGHSLTDTQIDLKSDVVLLCSSGPKPLSTPLRRRT